MDSSSNIAAYCPPNDNSAYTPSHDSLSPPTTTPKGESSKNELKFFSIHDIGDCVIADNESPLRFAEKFISAHCSVFEDAFYLRFNIFEFAKLTDRPLLVLGVYLLSRSPILHDLFSQKRADLLHCANFLDLCEKLYRDVQYHNSTHAADVMQFNFLLHSSSFSRHHFKDYEVLTSLMSAVVHDVGHAARNNDFLVKSNHELTQRFNKVSCLEQYHIEQLRSVLAVPSANWLQYLDQQQQSEMMSLMEHAVLGTDMGEYHQSIRSALKETYTAKWVAESYSRTLSVEEKKFLFRAMLHLSDISNPMRQFEIGWEWANRVNAEFFEQGDEMKEMDLEVTNNCDRSKTNVVQNQSGFVEYCLKPLAESMGQIIEELAEGLENIPINLKIMKQLNESTAIGMAE